MEVRVQIRKTKSGYGITLRDEKNEVIREMFQEYIPGLKEKTHYYLIKKMVEILIHYKII